MMVAKVSMRFKKTARNDTENRPTVGVTYDASELNNNIIQIICYINNMNFEGGKFENFNRPTQDNNIF